MEMYNQIVLNGYIYEHQDCTSMTVDVLHCYCYGMSSLLIVKRISIVLVILVQMEYIYELFIMKS